MTRFYTCLIGLFLVNLGNCIAQIKADSLINDFQCFSSIMAIGVTIGYWDSTIINSVLKDNCKNYIVQRNLKIENDTLFIIKTTDKSLDDSKFIGIKAIIDSDSSIVAYQYIDKIKLIGKSKKWMKKKGVKQSNEPLRYNLIFNEGNCIVDWYKD